VLDKTKLPSVDDFWVGQLGGKAHGQNIRLACPIHGGTNASSLSVSRSTGAWKCFNCEAHGTDVIDFIRQRDGLGFIAAASVFGAWVPDGTNAPKQSTQRIGYMAALEILSLECVVLAQEAHRIQSGKLVTDADVERLMEAAGRVQGVCADMGLNQIKGKK
jgi:CHC2 zinc finger